MTIYATAARQKDAFCHPLATRASVDARDLHELPLISFTGTLAIGAALESAFAEAGAVRRIGVEVGQSFLACALVNAGAGIAVIDELVVGHLRRGLVVKPFRPQRSVRLFALSRPQRLSLAAQALLDMLAKNHTAAGRKIGPAISTPRATKRSSRL